MFLTVLRLSLFIFSLYGYTVIFKKYLRFPEKISWIATCGFIILVLYASGYWNVLYPAGILLFIIGCLLGLLSFYQRYREKTLRLPTMNLLTIWLAFYFGLFALTLFHSGLEHYDNYSHWATIVKFLYTEGRLPTAADSIISFTSYPLGSSLFIYYATLIAGFGSNVMLIAQFILIFSGLYAMFVVVRDESRTLIITMMFTFIAVFNYFNIAIRMNNLLVDFLLPILTLAGLAGIYKMQRQLMQMSFFTILIAGALSVVKNSALFFVAVILIYYFSRVLLLWKFSKSKLSLIGTGLVTAVGSFLPYLLWSNHVKKSFPQSKHEINLSLYQQIFGEKDSSITKEITDLFITTIADLQTLSTQGIILTNLILVIAFLFIRYGLQRKNSLLRYGFLIDLTVITYYIGIYLMFLFSMPTEEALYLAGFDRYASSIVILILGIAMMVLAREIDYSFYEQNVSARDYRSFKNLKTKKWYQYSTLMLLFFSTILILSENNGMLYNNIQFEDSVPASFSKVTDNQMELNDNRYLVVTARKADVESYLVGYVGKYYLYSPFVEGQEDFMMEDQTFNNLLKSYDYIVILDDHFTFNVMTKKIYHRTFEPGVYPVLDIVGRK